MISGWAAFENAHATNNKINLVLKNGEQIYVSEVEQFLRPDVNERPGNKYDLNNSGFKTKLLKSSLPPGEYELGILIKNKEENIEGMIMANKRVDIKK
jgi:hypothetical protein